MIATRADLRLVLSGLRNGTSLGGGLVGEVLRDLTFTDGTQADGARAVNRMLYREDLTVLPGGSESIDLKLDEAPPDATLDLSTAKVLYCRAASTNSAELVVDFNQANGWNTEVNGTVSLPPGSEFLWIGIPTGPNVSPTAKIIHLFHLGGTGQVLEKLLVLGATA
jgi:hypothetical protein